MRTKLWSGTKQGLLSRGTHSLKALTIVRFLLLWRDGSCQAVAAPPAHEGWEVHHMDVKTAFLNDDLQKEIFVQQAPGFAHPAQENMVFKLHKALYGLHQAPRAWNQKLDEELVALVFVKCPPELDIYCWGVGTERLAVGVYVDDLIITGASCSSSKKFKSQMTEIFRTSDLGLLTYYLGIEVNQEGDGISLSQGSYV